jgi:medium-chain acyl-[acyl-carrier-protein] hydrolase
MPTTRWLNRKRAPNPHHRLFCFPYAGGGIASFQPWQSELGEHTEVCAVQLPGRGPRLLEPSVRSFEQLVEQLVGVVKANADLPFWLFGHSLGALLAFEVARRLQDQAQHNFCGLMISGCEAPHQRSQRPRLHELDDDALIERLHELNGTPRELLENRELMQLLLPSLRADFELFSNYRYQPAQTLDVPVTVFAGLHDDHVEHANIPHWRDQVNADFSIHWIPGDHFFIDSQRSTMLAHIRKALQQSPSAADRLHMQSPCK